MAFPWTGSGTDAALVFKPCTGADLSLADDGCSSCLLDCLVVSFAVAGLLTSASEDVWARVIAEMADDGGGRGDWGSRGSLVDLGPADCRAILWPPL